MADTKQDKPLYYDISKLPYSREIIERAVLEWYQLNWLISGLEMGGITVLTATQNAGKTTFVSQLITQVIKQGYKVFFFNGEQTEIKTQQTLYKQVTPYNKDKVIEKTYIQNGQATNIKEWFVDKEDERKAQELFDDKLFIFNNEVGTEIDKLLEAMKKNYEEKGSKIFVVDNLMQIELNNDNENKEVKDNTEKLRRFALKYNVHIILVAHIRKPNEVSVIRPSAFDIAGTMNIANKAMNVISLIRTDRLDPSTKEYKSLKKILELNNYDLDAKTDKGERQVDCVVEVLKTKGNRLGFSCMTFWTTTKTFREVRKIDERFEEKEKAIVMTEIHNQESLDDINEIFGI